MLIKSLQTSLNRFVEGVNILQRRTRGGTSIEERLASKLIWCEIACHDREISMKIIRDKLLEIKKNLTSLDMNQIDELQVTVEKLKVNIHLCTHTWAIPRFHSRFWKMECPTTPYFLCCIRK